MKNVNGQIQLRDKIYPMVFNLNVMERIQEEYGSLEKWGNLTDGKNGEPNAKAVIFGFMEMINEGIDIRNEEEGTSEKLLTRKQAGRIITEYGLLEATKKLNATVIESTKAEAKNV